MDGLSLLLLCLSPLSGCTSVYLSLCIDCCDSTFFSLNDVFQTLQFFNFSWLKFMKLFPMVRVFAYWGHEDILLFSSESLLLVPHSISLINLELILYMVWGRDQDSVSPMWISISPNTPQCKTSFPSVQDSAILILSQMAICVWICFWDLYYGYWLVCLSLYQHHTV